MPLEAILAEVAIEGESVVHPLMIDQSKTCAIDKAEVFVIVSQENCLRRLFNRVAYTKCFDASLVKTLYECDRRRVTDFGANQRIGLGEDKIGS